MLSRRDRRRVRRELNELNIQFPQLRVSVTTVDGIPEKLNLSVYTFWLFNRSDVVRKFDTDGRNYDVLFTIDARTRRIALIVGYGLEPFVGQEQIRQVLDTGYSMLVADRHAAALLTMLEALSAMLRKAGHEIASTFALPPTPEGQKKPLVEAALEY